MSNPVNHHYLPVFYLKQWCGNDGKVYRYWRPHGDVVAHSIAPKNTGYEPALYGLEGYEPDQRNMIERQFMGPVVDGPASEALPVLIARDDSKLTSQLRIAWTRFLMSLRLRNPTMVRDISEQAKQSLRHGLLDKPEEYDALRGKDDPPTLLGWAEKNQPAVFADFGKLLLPELIDSPQIGNTIIKMRWWTLDLGKSRFSLLTCDNPFYMTHGIAEKSCVIALPLSPRFLFLSTRYPETIDRIMSHSLDDIAKRMNESIVAQAVKHVYGVTKTHRRFVENRLRR